jgi:large conductance mechanosensitive channel
MHTRLRGKRADQNALAEYAVLDSTAVCPKTAPSPLFFWNGGAAMSFLREFREFAVKGNAVDMAVGIVLGVAFNKIVHTIVDDILMPPIGLLIGGVDFKDLEIVLRQARTGADGAELPAVAIRYGALINVVVEFLIIALTVFIVVKMMNRIIRGRESASA